MAQIENNYPEDVRVVYRHFPLISIHDKAALATQASDAAGAQGEFWALHDLLFEHQAEWSALSVEQFQDWLVEQAAELGLDEDQFSADMLSEENAAQAQFAFDDAVNMGLPGTPFLLVNDQYYGGPRDYGSMESLVELLFLEDQQFTECPPMVIDPLKNYSAILHTENGDITIELYAEDAPLAVNNFVFLANEGWYDGVTFHRVLPGFVAQAGDPTGTGLGGPGYAFENEISDDLSFNRAGVVGMANAGPDSNGSQFYITFAPVPHLDGGYTIFGQVIAGMDVVESITPRDPQQGASLPPGDRIVSVTIVEK
ncbi:MAG: peptidylprolyl isomerase [Anaerolineales bacterium]|nr:peptidylprolyl isomerase [Anaerolineales bacterium]